MMTEAERLCLTTGRSVYTYSVEWAPKPDSFVTLAGGMFFDKDECRNEMAQRMALHGYTPPRWWQWWRWSERKHGHDMMARIKRFEDERKQR